MNRLFLSQLFQGEMLGSVAGVSWDILLKIYEHFLKAMPFQYNEKKYLQLQNGLAYKKGLSKYTSKFLQKIGT